jgi:hypothetical protein
MTEYSFRTAVLTALKKNFILRREHEEVASIAVRDLMQWSIEARSKNPLEQPLFVDDKKEQALMETIAAQDRTIQEQRMRLDHQEKELRSRRLGNPAAAFPFREPVKPTPAPSGPLWGGIQNGSAHWAENAHLPPGDMLIGRPKKEAFSDPMSLPEFLRSPPAKPMSVSEILGRLREECERLK